MKIHKNITLEKVMAACERRDTSLDNPGFCLACGKKHNNCEPDARNYVCKKCGERQVFGAEEILFMF